MTTYTFQSAKLARIATVEANNEAEAREEAMYEFWGNPSKLTLPVPDTDKYLTIGHNGFVGEGLLLVAVT